MGGLRIGTSAEAIDLNSRPLRPPGGLEPLISLEDDLMRIFGSGSNVLTRLGMEEGQAIRPDGLPRIEGPEVEERHFSRRAAGNTTVRRQRRSAVSPAILKDRCGS